MPGMKGDEFVKTLKLKFPNINIVMLTGQITNEISSDLIEKNIIHKLIEKPWKENELFAIVDSIQEYE
jgi:response regulator RpfG family c-di-GMP phosphodiesterase